MKILYILTIRDIERLDQMGPTAHIIGVVEGLMKLGNDVSILSHEKIPFLNPNKTIRYDFFNQMFNNPASKNKFLRFFLIFADNLLQVFDIYRTIKKRKPNVVYLRWGANPFVHWVNRKICKRMNVFVVTECNTPSTLLSIIGTESNPKVGLMKNLVFKLSDIACIKLSDLIVVVSKKVRDFLIHEFRVHPCMLLVNPNGVDVMKFDPATKEIRNKLDLNEKQIVIGMISRFDVHFKQTDVLIEIFQELVDDGMENLILLMVGSGRTLNDLKKLAALQHSERIIFTGKIPYKDIPDYIASCDILVSPQKELIKGGFHGSPLKIFEYMSMGKPILASKVGQIQETIDDGIDGLLFKWDDREEFKQKLKILIQDDQLRRTLGVRARQKAVDRYSWMANVNRLIEKVHSRRRVFF